MFSDQPDLRELIRWLRVAIEMVRRFKWLFIAVYYFGLFAVLGYKAFLILLPVIFVSFMIFESDKQREVEGKDDFRDGRLFYRYGEECDSTAISLPVSSQWNAEETASFARAFQARLASQIAERLPEEEVRVTGSLAITDLGSGEKKDFLRVLVRSKFGSQLTHFVHYASFSKTITAHYFTYLRGTYRDWDVVAFVLGTPFTIWFWLIPWALNRYSIIATISKFRASSFEGIDLNTMFSLTNQVVYEETTRALQDAGLLTEEVRQALHYHLHEKIKIGGQKVKIDASPGARIEGVSHSISALPPTA